MPQLKDVVKEILAVEAVPGGKIPDVVQVLTVDETYRDIRKFIVLTPLPEKIADNGANHWSLIGQDLEIMIAENDENRTPEVVIESVRVTSDAVRGILRRNNGKLISTSAPAPGFAIRSRLSDVYIAELELIDGIARHGGKIVMHADFFKEEAIA